MRAIIVDDEELARQVIREHLIPHRDIEIIAECANGLDAVKSVAELRPDLAFLDIQMPKLSGFEVLELIEPRPEIIFVTAYDSFAIKAFDVHAVDYLLKPFDQDRFDESLRRARVRIAEASPNSMGKLLRAIHSRELPLERILVRDGVNVHVIPVEAVDSVEAQDDYIVIHASGKRHWKLQRLSDLESMLDHTRFVRIHRSHIVNLERLARLETYAKDSRIAVLKDGRSVPVSRAGYDKLKKLL